MGRITQAQILAAYKVSKEVFIGDIKRSEGVLLLSNTYSLNKASAGDFINCLKYMMEGRIFHRAMSHTAMDYFIGSIANDFSSDALGNALNALQQHIDYWETHYKTNAISMRKVLDKYQGNTLKLVTAESLQLQLEQDIAKSTNLSSTKRLKMINFSNPEPKKLMISVTVYQRNHHVIVERLKMAAGICEKCKMKAPFMKAKDGTPYLEVHHKQRLSDGGLDILENTMALCPNCHRELHFG